MCALTECTQTGAILGLLLFLAKELTMAAEIIPSVPNTYVPVVNITEKSS